MLKLYQLSCVFSTDLGQNEDAKNFSTFIGKLHFREITDKLKSKFGFEHFSPPLKY